MSDRPKPYFFDQPAGGWPEGSNLHGSTYTAVYLTAKPELRIGSLRTHPDGSYTATTNFTAVDGGGPFTSEESAVEWMLGQMLESGQWTANTALIALGRM